ncbi:hypothetical protein [Bacillus taeanensis]|uniref:Tissue inhibitor of metalloproteinase n=1 Tax=Bacillus taeanensis TaxID=273032 RepID=A0A366XV82_9BACI|nr:hypothetical protein [Bacillus taeanensis]RBW68044.1 hypothetical protein DS031_19095 [Bacillus taeanensis]
MKKLLPWMISFLIIMSFILVFFPKSIYACSCIEPGTPSEELNNSKAVFTGKVLEITEDETNYEKEVVFEVLSTYKGVTEPQVTLYTGMNSAACGFNFTVGEEYLVYATGDGRLQTTLCSRTAELAAANEDLKELGKGEEPEKEVEVKEDSGNPFPFSIVLVIVGLVVIGAVIFSRKR